MYRTRNDMVFSAPRPIFWTLSITGGMNVLGVLALYAFVVSILVVRIGCEGSVVTQVAEWSWVVFLGCVGILWTSVGCLVAFNSNDIEYGDNSVNSAYRDIALSGWGRAAGWAMVIRIVVLVVVKSQISGPTGTFLKLLVLSVLCRALWRLTIRSNRELRRVMRVSATTPLFVQAGGYVENETTRELRGDVGPDWAHPDIVHDAQVAKRFEKAAAARARILFIMGRAMAWASAPIAIASVSWLVGESRPGPLVGLPMLAIAALVLGWVLERRSRRFDSLADDYRSASVAERSSLLRRKFDTMQWIPGS